MPGDKFRAFPIGHRLKTLRQQRDLSQREVANMMGVSDGTLSDYETGNSEPRPDFLTRFAEEFNTTVEWLVTG
jgi:transcriptional regulator with XRE-family HTH domain